jgi:mRNA interferase RelE/StbE
MIVEFDKSFEKWLSNISEATILKKVEQAILKAEIAKTIQEIPNAKKLIGYKNYYRIRIGDYRMGFERISKTTIRFIIVADRKEIYRRFP